MLKKCSAISIAIFALATIFTACGDDSTVSINNNENTGAESSPSLTEGEPVFSGGEPQTPSSSFNIEVPTSSAKDTTVVSSSSTKNETPISSTKEDDDKSSSSINAETTSSSSVVKPNSSSVDNLSSSSEYTVIGVSYGRFVDSRDGQIYKTIKLGNG